MRNAGLSPDERGYFEREMEEYAKEALQRMRQGGNGKADYGYDEFRRREEEKRRRRSDELEYRKWRDRFRHLDDETDGLN